MKSLKKLQNRLNKFHNDEAGLEALQVVMIVAIAAVVLITIKLKYPAIKEWFNSTTDEIMEFES